LIFFGASLNDVAELRPSRAAFVWKQTVQFCYAGIMKCNEAISRLKRHEADLKRLGVDHLYMFGSTARDEPKDESDVDLFFNKIRCQF
jgi:hypothetical protein